MFPELCKYEEYYATFNPGSGIVKGDIFRISEVSGIIVDSSPDVPVIPAENLRAFRHHFIAGPARIFINNGNHTRKLLIRNPAQK
ncbi:hypothetical protein EGD84_21030 [Salmonella enterica]|nr:hypothetical protein [Salmonella enterica]